MEEVRREGDGELCGHVEQRGERWCALAVFGAVLGEHDDRAAAVGQVQADGLASLADRWTLRALPDGEPEVVCITEANAASVTVALGYYSLPGVPTSTITRDQLNRGEWELHR